MNDVQLNNGFAEKMIIKDHRNINRKKMDHFSVAFREFGVSVPAFRIIIDVPFSSFLRIPLNFGRPFFQKFGLKPIPCFLKKEGLKGGSGQITRTGSSGFATS